MRIFRAIVTDTVNDERSFSQQSSAAGAIGSASAYGVGGSRFEPWVVQLFFCEIRTDLNYVENSWKIGRYFMKFGFRPSSLLVR